MTPLSVVETVSLSAFDLSSSSMILPVVLGLFSVDSTVSAPLGLLCLVVVAVAVFDCTLCCSCCCCRRRLEDSSNRSCLLDREGFIVFVIYQYRFRGLSKVII